jgi:class 3 adenylate cyclase/tetratricopeptide (TPR) repeat protein
LDALGLGQYAAVFAENDVDLEVLPHLTDQELKDLGVSLGHRKRLLNAAAALVAADQKAKPGGPPASAPPTPDPVALAAPQAERRQLTVLFCDLVGSTALSARLDPEDLRAVIGAYHRCCTAVIERAGGFVAKYMGDGLLAYFGYPRADEHDAERAAHAGLALVEAVAGLDTAAGVPLQARVGIATGLVVVGDLIGEGEARERGVVGETPNLAARLQTMAEPGTVVIGPSTRLLTGGLFDYADLGPIEIKGLAAPVAASRVVRESAAESRFAALRTTATPLVGRDEELALLQRRWQQAKSGEGSVVLVSGEPGIGKSRLAQTLIERLSGEPHTGVRLFCSPHHQDSALDPTITQLERAAAFRREDTLEQRLDKLEAVLAQAIGDLDEAAPLLAALLSLPTGDRYPPLNLTPQKQKEKTFRALVAHAHWSDPTSLELLDLIVDRASALRVLLIVTFRPEFNPPWTGRPHVTSLGLNRLAPRQRAEMITGVTGGKALPKEITDQIIDRTDGVPLFVEELTKAVVESSMLTDAGDRYTATSSLMPLAIPATLQASLLARLDRLAPVRELAQIGAALGRQFTHELISAVASMPPAQLDNALAQLVGAELIYRRGTPPDAEYTFKHALVQDASYSTLLRSRRLQLHAHIAAVLEARSPETVAAQPVLLAHHCEEAGLTDKAVEYWRAAGQQAWGRSATAEAVALLRRGLALVPALPDGERRREREFDLQIALSRALEASRSWGAPELDNVHSRARELALALKRPRALLFALWGQWCDTIYGRVDLEQAQRLAAELRALGDTGSDVLIQGMGCWAGGMTCFFLGNFTAGRIYYEKALALYDPAHRAPFSELMSFDMQVGLRVNSSWPLACLGHVDHASFECDTALGEARRLSHPPTLALAVSGLALIGSFVGLRPATLLQHADETLALATEYGLGYQRAKALILRGWCLAGLGCADEGIRLLITGLADWDQLGFNSLRPWALTRLGDACRMAGQSQSALGHLAEARRLAQETDNRWFLPETFRLTGDVLLATGDRVTAEASYCEAIAIAQQQSAKLWELRAATSLARLWRDQGKRTEAYDLLSLLYGWFTEGFGTPVLQDAKALLEELAA